MNLLKYFLSLTLILGPYAQAWDQATSKVVQVDQASGVSSTPNYWKSGDAELTLAGVAGYNDGAVDKPVDCTGGSPTMTVARSTTAPMYDKQSWLITKPASNVQGQGISFEFDVDNGISQVEMMDLMFDYIVNSGTFAAGSDTTNSDIMIYLYDVTAGKLIEPYGGSKLYTSATDVKGDYRGWFQSTLGSKKYRVCLHQATTSASAYSLKVDAGKVQKSKQVVGTIITDWQSYTTNVSGLGSGSTQTLQAQYMRVGPDIFVKIISRKDSTAGTGTASVAYSLPSGLQIDTVISPNGNPLNGSGLKGSGADSVLVPYQLSNTTVALAQNDASLITGSEFLANQAIIINFQAPIQGWSAGARMSDGYDGVPLYLKVQANNTASPLTLTTTLQPIPFQTVVRDPLGCFNTTTGVCTVPRSSFYCAAGNASFQITGTMPGVGTEIARLELTIGNAGQIDQWFSNGASTTGGNQKLAVTACSYVSAGQTISLRARKDTSVSAATGTITQYADGNNLSVWDALQGSAIMSPTALWETHYAGTAGDAIGTSLSLIKFTTKIEDTFGSYNPSTGLWTAKGPAICSASWSITAVVNLSPSQRFRSNIYKNGVSYRNGIGTRGVSVSTELYSIGSVLSIPVQTGDTLSIYAVSDVATTAAPADVNSYFTVSCRQSGN